MGKIILIKPITPMADIGECVNVLGWFVSIPNQNTCVYSRKRWKLNIYNSRAYWLSKFIWLKLNRKLAFKHHSRLDLGLTDLGSSAESIQNLTVCTQSIFIMKILYISVVVVSWQGRDIVPKTDDKWVRSMIMLGKISFHCYSINHKSQMDYTETNPFLRC